MTREEKVAVFNKLTGTVVATDPEKVPLHVRKLALKLIFEELAEFAEASGLTKTMLELCDRQMFKTLDIYGGLEIDEEDSLESFNNMCAARGIEDTDEVDAVEQLDALCDVQYTASWAVNTCGHAAHFEAAFDEVCRSNNSKACKTIEEAEATKAHWEKEHGPCNIWPIEDYYVVKDAVTGKVKKSIKYSKADFKQFLK